MNIPQLVADFVYARSALVLAKLQLFPLHKPVIVNCPRYRGHGVRVPDHGEPPEQIAVRLENGNVWWYPIENCQPAQWSHIHPADRRSYLNYRGRRCEGRVFRTGLPPL